MFTVVIAEQEHISAIEEFHMFLQPFLASTQVAFCQWIPDGAALDDMVPQLRKTVNRREEWRAIVVCDEGGLKQQNPFNRVVYTPPQHQQGQSQEEYLDTVWQRKREAFDLAAQQPLTRLMSYLCQGPLISVEKGQTYQDPEFALYQKEAEYKQELRRAITAGCELEISAPAQVLCLAKRTYVDEERALRTLWTSHVDHQYSRFYDWNLYFDKMRYLVFDILPKNHENYTFDYIRFLYGLLLLANHEVPQSSLQPRRLYILNSEDDEQRLRELFGRYEGKLAATDEVLTQQIRQLENRTRRRLSDQEAEAIFCAHVTVPVTMIREFEETDLYVDHRGLGLATDCPTSELSVWSTGHDRSRKALHRFMKQPRRAVKRAADDVRNLNHVDLDRVGELNRFQLEDVAEYIQTEELSMVTTPTRSLTDISDYEVQLDEAAQEVEKKIDARMTRKTTIALGALALGLFLVGFLPSILKNSGETSETMGAIWLTVGALGLLAVIGLVGLYVLRRALKRKFSQYNAAMQGLVEEVTSVTRLFSKYLSHGCNVMRGYQVLNKFQSHEDPEVGQIKVLKKHRMDILRCREELHEVFGRFLTQPPVEPQTPYQYDFHRPVDYPYPLPHEENRDAQIEFVQPGHVISVPVDFVRRVTIRMEELYD